MAKPLSSTVLAIEAATPSVVTFEARTPRDIGERDPDTVMGGHVTVIW